MKKLAPLALLVAVLAGCNDSDPAPAKTQADVAPPACVEALRAQFAAAFESGQTGSRPAECEGVSDKALEDAVGQVLGEQ